MKYPKLVLGLALLGLCATLSVSIYRFHYDSLSTANAYGTYHSPYSDALGPWLYGGLELLHKGEIASNVVRPLVSFYIASVYNLFGKIEAYSWFNLSTLLISSVAIFFLDWTKRITVLLFFCLLTLHYPFWGYVFPTKLLPDFASLLFTFIGSLLISEMFQYTKRSYYVGGVGFLFIGLACGVEKNTNSTNFYLFGILGLFLSSKTLGHFNRHRIALFTYCG